MSEGINFDPALDPLPASIEWAGDRIRLVDQRRLPEALVFVEATTVDELCGHIRVLAVRGAPSLGLAGALGMALADRTGVPLDEAARRLRATRPTAVNLAWGIDQVRYASDPLEAAQRLGVAEVEAHVALGRHGAALVAPDARVLTHCNAGGLACVRYGSAVGVIRAAHEEGRRPSVWVGETRPLLQGARLTMWELDRLDIPCTLIADVMAAGLFATGDIDLVVVGADRIAANGDVANKVGTYGLAVLAHHHGVPFYVAAPTSTVDPRTPDGSTITIEQRDPDEVLYLAGRRIAPPGVAAANRAFDVTPARLVSAWITETGVHRRPPAGDVTRSTDG